MNELCVGFATLKSYGAIAVSMHGTHALVTFVSMGDASAFSHATRGATLETDFIVRVDLNAFLRN